MAHFVVDKNSPYEKFYQTPDGKLIFLTVPKIGSDGVENTIHYSELHERISRHFYLGDGWPKGHPDPEVVREGVIWRAFRNERAKNEEVKQ